MAAGPRVGEPAPDFELDGTNGRFRLSEHRGERVVLLFYPGDETPVCTKQFCSYAEREDELAALDATVVGISAQDVASHRSFQRAHGIPVPLLADTDRTVAEAYGVAHRGRPGECAQRLYCRADREARCEQLPIRTRRRVESTIAGEPHERVAGEGRRQQKESEEIAAPHHLFEQSTF